MDRNKIDFPIGIFFFQKSLFELSYETIDIITDDFRRACSDDWYNFHMRIPHQKHIYCFLDAFESTEHCTILVYRGRRNLKASFERLGEQHADEHNAALSSMNYRDTILYSNAGILRSTRLTCEYWVDNATTLSLFYFTRHNFTFFNRVD